MKRLKRVVIKEELYELTGSGLKAVILNQFIYWSERISDFDDFIKEELQRIPDYELDFRYGWIYKTAEDMNCEIMMGVSDSTVRRTIKELVDSGWLKERNNPKHRWDRTLQYRVNFEKLINDLSKIGYSLEGYPLLVQSGIIPHFSN